MAQLYNIDDDVIYFQADSTGSVSRGTIASVSKLDTTYLYTFDNVQGSFYERMICGLYSDGAAALKTSADTELTRQHDAVVANADAGYAAYLEDAESNIDDLFS